MIIFCYEKLVLVSDKNSVTNVSQHSEYIVDLSSILFYDFFYLRFFNIKLYVKLSSA